MRDIDGTMTLTELANRLKASKSVLGKYAEALDIKEGTSGQRGLRSGYNQRVCELFRRVLYLRSLGYGIEDIKNYREDERKIHRLVIKNFSSGRLTFAGNQAVGLSRQADTNRGVISLYLISDVFESDVVDVGIDNQSFQKELAAGNKEAVELNDLLVKRRQRLEYIISVSKSALVEIEEKEKFIKEETSKIRNILDA